jgi:hypothetical protein
MQLEDDLQERASRRKWPCLRICFQSLSKLWFLSMIAVFKCKCKYLTFCHHAKLFPDLCAQYFFWRTFRDNFYLCERMYSDLILITRSYYCFSVDAVSKRSCLYLRCSAKKSLLAYWIFSLQTIFHLITIYSETHRLVMFVTLLAFSTTKAAELVTNYSILDWSLISSLSTR